jgi:transposase
MNTKKITKKTKVIIPNKKPVGRPTKYLPIYAEQAKKLAIIGLIDKEIFDILGISEVTGIEWKKKYPEFAKSLKEGKEFPDKKVVAALFDNAIGKEYETEKALVVSDGKDYGAHIEIVKVKEYHPGNVTAQIYWTKNRLPKEWRDKVDLEHSGKMEYKVIPDEILEDKE